MPEVADVVVDRVPPMRSCSVERRGGARAPSGCCGLRLLEMAALERF